MSEQQRIDKWLWCARIYKTRAIAADAIKNGRVSINGIRTKPARTVKPGDKLIVEKPPYSFHIEILAIANQRQSATNAMELYAESTESIEQRRELSDRIQASKIVEDRRFGKLNKKQRRDREKFIREL